MIKPGDIVKKVIVTKSDNIGDDTGEEGYDVDFHIGKDGVSMQLYYIKELENQPKGIYSYDGIKYIQIENWEE